MNREMKAPIEWHVRVTGRPAQPPGLPGLDVEAVDPETHDVGREAPHGQSEQRTDRDRETSGEPVQQPATDDVDHRKRRQCGTHGDYGVAGKPAIEGRVGIINHLVPFLVPVDGFCCFCPE